MNDEIHFGELEHREPGRQRRPDENLHYAVVPYAAPRESDLPVYVDLDVLREMEQHARSNMHVELGGVLLGAPYTDERGRPFVVVSDSLRAEHYEATRGSFKFTHETWSAITRQRDRFPDDLQMVGWYHTHPDWGVFLSGMDTFICDHFFNKPLDVALVIDPCRRARAFFQWDGPPDARQLRATSGFFVTASRFRQWDLETYVASLESRTLMTTDPRYSPAGGLIPAVVQVTDSRPPWFLVAVLGTLAAQFLLVALLAWQILLGPTTRPPAAAAPAQNVAAERKMLDRIIGRLDVAPEGLVAEMEEQRRKNEELGAANLGLFAQVQTLEQAQAEAEQAGQALEQKVKRLETALAELQQERRDLQQKVTGLRKQLAAADEETAADGEPATWRDKAWAWRWYLGCGLLAVCGLALVGMLQSYFGTPASRPGGHEDGPDDGQRNEPRSE